MSVSSLKNNVARRRPLDLTFAVFVYAVLTALPAAATELPDFDKLVSSHESQLAALSSERDARELFQSLALALSLPSSDVAQSPDALAMGTELITDLATWRLADSISKAINLHDPMIKIGE